MNIIRAIFNFPICESSILLRTAHPELMSVRYAGHKVNQGRRQKAKMPGVKRMEGDTVRKGDMLVKQFGLHFHPGLNVDIDNKNTLTAMADGYVIMTCEKINPKKENPTAEKYYANLAAPVVYKRFFHVIPFEQGRKFKLVNLV